MSYLQVGGASFEVHKYLLKRFNLLKAKVCELPSDEPLLVQGDRGIAGDFRNTFKVLYATVLEGPFEFDNPTLVSALRIATTYDYPALRTYTIARLEQAQLTAVERIEIAREFGLASWEEPAYVELCERDEPITAEEANILGMEMFVRVAEIREREQRRRGKELDAGQKETSAVRSPDSVTTGPPGGASVTRDSEGSKVRLSEASSSMAGRSDPTCNSHKVGSTVEQHEEGESHFVTHPTPAE